MVLEIHIEGIEAYRKAAEDNKDKTVFVLFGASLDKEGNNWCPDCVAAHPVVMRNLKYAPDDAIFIHCGVGERTFWKDQSNIFRTDPKLKLKSIPTLIRIGKPQKLEEEQCTKDDLVKMIFEED